MRSETSSSSSSENENQPTTYDDLVHYAGMDGGVSLPAFGDPHSGRGLQHHALNQGGPYGSAGVNHRPGMPPGLVLLAGKSSMGTVSSEALWIFPFLDTLRSLWVRSQDMVRAGSVLF
uniref:Uncharacterized protein n=1 Tax=Naja naja TaxID=35670 RepID=A0A8C6VNX2_NAJNA